ncbi:MAG: hypothetical protein GXP39_12230 [Chloroflexi bacterium]|nr:hypothetical protein [Chloroflexota bacterium]
MAEQNEQQTTSNPPIPDKCAHCRFLDKEHDHLAQTTHLYCRAPWWHPKRWTCALPPGVARA